MPTFSGSAVSQNNTVYAAPQPEYTTVYDVRNTLVGNAATGQDTLYLDLIRSTSRDMDGLSGQTFAPRVETLKYDLPKGRVLNFGSRTVLEITSITNGDGNTIASDQYTLEPANESAKWKLEINAYSNTMFYPSLTTLNKQAITVVAITGYHPDYSNAWRQIDTLAVAISSTSATSMITTGSALVHSGDFLKIDSEFIYPSAVTTTTSTIIRGIAGSTAATHLINAPIYKWVNPSIEMICRTAVLAQERLKNNPLGDTINIGGYTFNTPKDVTRHLHNRLSALGLISLT